MGWNWENVGRNGGVEKSIRAVGKIKARVSWRDSKC